MRGAYIEFGRLRDGFPTLAKWITRDPDEDPLIFKKFGRHSARILLRLQCQLVSLEKEIDDLDEQARTSEDLDTRRSLQPWEALMMGAENTASIEHKLVKKIDEFRLCLREYCRSS